MKRLLELVLELHEHALLMVDPAPDPDAPAAEPGSDDAHLLPLARHLIGLRRSRDTAFGVDGLFGDPAWDILMEILVAEMTGRHLSVTAACIGAAAPTTGLRWLRRLENENLVAREHDANDKRRIYVRLTERGSVLMRQMLRQLAFTRA